jgi:hypothetical protein
VVLRFLILTLCHLSSRWSGPHFAVCFARDAAGFGCEVVWLLWIEKVSVGHSPTAPPTPHSASPLQDGARGALGGTWHMQLKAVSRR